MVATAGITVARTLRRKALTTSTTSTSEISSVISISFSDARIEYVRSDDTCIVMSCGSSARNSGSKALTASTVSITFAPGWRLTSTTTAGSPLNKPSVFLSSTLSITSATSDSRTGAPLRQASTRSR